MCRNMEGFRDRRRRKRCDDDHKSRMHDLAANARTLLARQLTKSIVLSAQISKLDRSADLPSAYFPRRST
jgi:hypothetical protein